MPRIAINKIKPNPNNPRLIRDFKYQELLESIDNLTSFTEVRPLIVDEDMIVLGGNQRYKIMQELKWKTVPYVVYTREAAEKDILKRAEKRAKKLQELIDSGADKLEQQAFLPKTETYEDLKKELVIKDNLSYGNWDWDALSDEWSNEEMKAMGMDVWVDQKTEDYNPNFSPTIDTSEITDIDIQKGKENKDKNLYDGTQHKLHATICPECAHEFNIELE